VSTHDRVPEAAGEPTTEALIEQLATASWASRRELVGALSARGEAAVGALIAALETRREDEARIAALVDALVGSTGAVETHMFELAGHSDPALLADVAQILGRRRNPLALPTLARLTRHADDNVAVAAIEALGRTATHGAIDALVACVESDHFFRTFPAIDLLGRTGDPRAVPPLARLLENPRYAFEAARALGRTADRSAVAPLVELLDSPSSASVKIGCLALNELCERHSERFGVATAVDESLRGHCSEARLRRMGQSLASADRAEKIAICRVFEAFRDGRATHWLLQLLDDDQVEVARAAGAALRVVGKTADETLALALQEPHSARRAVLLPIVARASQTDAVVACLSDRESGVRALACEALARIGAVSATPQLFALLGDESARVVHAAMAAIQALGSDATEALALQAARSSKLETRRAGLRILAYFGPSSAFEVFAASVHDPDVRLRDTAIHGLALLEHEDASALLIELASEPDPKVRAAAMRAQGQARASDKALQSLRAGLSDGDSWVRYYACQALGKQRDRASVEHIAALVSDEAGQVRVAAIEALSHLTGDVALAALRASVQSDDPDVKRAALLGLGLSSDQSSLPLLLEALAVGEPATRLVSLSALSTFHASEVTRALAQAARDSDESVRTAALGYLAASDDETATAELIGLALTGPDAERTASALATPHEKRAPALLRALAEADQELAPRITSFLSRLRSEAGRAALFEALQLPSSPARLAAVSALAVLGSREAHAAIARAAEHDDDPEVRRVSALCLAR
jgi:HEAT repeat protein